MFQLKNIQSDLSISNNINENLISLFELQVKSNPNKKAIFHNNRSITYEELNCQANAIADYLLELGIKEGNIVTILLERGLNLIVAILGILKTGAAYVVIDVDYPISRIQYILYDTNYNLLLTEASYQDQPKYKYLLASPSSQHVCISDLLSNIKNHTVNPSIQSNGDTLACIIYTSGSTGKPKGTLLNHKSFYRLFNGPNMVQTSNADSIAQIASATFDLAVYDIWAALGQGGSLVIIDKEIALSPEDLEESFQKYNITTALLPTGLFHQLVRIDPTIFKSLKNVLIAGEAANPEIIRQVINSHCKPQKLFNLYGPTECAVFATYYEIKAIDNHAVSVSIGMPVNDTQVYVLNDNLEEVQTGEIGELYLSGIGLARGYLNLPDLTAERFIACPFDTDCKMYKTGDLVKMLPDGNMDFIGRKDNQVKIRGFRIELDEVAGALESHPDIFQGVVLAPCNHEDNKHLVAYFTSKNKAEKMDIESVRSYLKKILPDYMLPNVIIQLDSLPLNSHGKVDRNALLNNPLNQGKAGSDNTEESLNLTKMESLFLKIWKKTLNLDQIKIDDNFFNLGGDSILVMQMLAQVAEHGITLKHSLVLQYPTIRLLASLNEKEDQIQEEVLDNNPFPLSAIQNWYFELGLTNVNYFHHLFFSSLKKTINITYLKKALQNVVSYHDAFRLRFIKDAEGYKQYYSNDLDGFDLVEVDIEGLSKADIEEITNSYRDELCKSIDIYKGPLIKVALFIENEKPKNLIIVIHHLIIDGISWRIFMNDLTKVYKQLIEQSNCRLPLKISSFKNWVLKTREYASTKNLLRQGSYWLNVTNMFVLPIDYEKGENLESSNRIVLKTLDLETTQGLLKIIPQVFNVDINDILLTAFFKTISQWSGQTEVLLDLEGHGREDIVNGIHVSRVIGWFTGLFPVVLKSDAKSLKSCLFEIQSLLEKIPLKGTGYGILKYLNGVANIKKQLNFNPEVSIRFNYLGQFEQNFNDDQLFEIIGEPLFSPSDPKNQRTHLLIVESWVTQGKLQIAWHYSGNYHNVETIEDLASTFNEFLQLLLQEAQAAQYVSIDTSLIAYDLEELNEIIPSMEEVQAIYPLTPIQKGFLFHAIDDIKSEAYFIQTYWHCARQYNAQAMIDAWDLLVRRHELLRAAYIWDGVDQPLQIIYQKGKISILEKDWKIYSLEEQEKKINEYLNQDRQLGFDITKAPLMRLTVIHLTDKKQLMVWSLHHIIIDNLSTCKVIEELDYYYSTLYDRHNSLIVRPSFFKDYLQWQRRQNYDINKRFWQNYLDGFTQANEISFAKEVRLNILNSYDKFEHILSKQLAQLLHEYASDNKLTLNAIMQGVWAYLLSLYCNTTDIVFGLTVTTRPLEIQNVKSIVGPLINTLPFRIIIDKNLSILEYFQEIQRNLGEIIDHSFCSHINIQQESEILHRNALYHSAFIFESQQIELANKLSFFYDIKTDEMTHYPLFLYVIPDENIRLKISFKLDWYFNVDVKNLLNNYVALLFNVVGKENLRNEFHCLNFSECGLPKNNLLDSYFWGHKSSKAVKLSTSPRDELEQKIAKIWSDVLKKKVLNIDDNFFDLGGESFLAITLVSRLRKELEIKLGVRTIFDAPTIRQLSEVIHDALADISGIPFVIGKDAVDHKFIIPIQIKGDKKPLFLIHPVGGTVFCYRSLQNYIYDRPIYAIEDPGINGEAEDFNSLEELAAYYLQGIKQIQPEGPYLLGGLSLGGLISIAIAKQLNDSGESIAFIGLFDTWAVSSDENNQKGWFEQHMQDKHKEMEQHLLHVGCDPKDSCFDLQLHRNKLGLKYKIPSISNKVTLLKAKTFVDIFTSYDSPTNFWRNFCHNLEVNYVPGDHYSMLNQENIEEFAKILKECIP